MNIWSDLLFFVLMWYLDGRGSFSSPSKGAGKVARVDVYHSAASTMSYSIFY